MNTGRRTRVRTVVTCVALAALSGLAACSQGPATAPAQSASATPDLSGYWNLMRSEGAIPADEDMMSQVSADAAVLEDTGIWEYPRGEFGGLKLKPEAVRAAEEWDPLDDMTISNTCKPPSIVYAMQGPFPIEIFQTPELIVIKLEYYDLVRLIFMDGRKADANYPLSKTGFSVGHWEGDDLVVETSHLAPATITNNGLSHSDQIRVIERFRLSEDGNTLMATQEFSDPAVLDNKGARFIAWEKEPGQHVYPYECDPSFAVNYSQGEDK